MNTPNANPLDQGSPATTRSRIAMDTLVTVRVDAQPGLALPEMEAAMERALSWFAKVEAVCSRFDPDSELMALCRRPGRAVRVSPLLFQAVSFALAVAGQTRGAFDPTIGRRQQQRGFSHNYRETAPPATETRTPAQPAGTTTPAASGRPSPRPALPVEPLADYRDVRLDTRRSTITLLCPLLLDLGAVAKGLAIDLAARELTGFHRYAVDAGGDAFLGAATGARPWRVGIERPDGGGQVGTLVAGNVAVCTSGGGERPAASPGEHHLLDPRTNRSPRSLLGVTVIATTAMVADALGTAAFVLGPGSGRRLLEQQGTAYVLIDRSGMVRYADSGMTGLQWQLGADDEP